MDLLKSALTFNTRTVPLIYIIILTEVLAISLPLFYSQGSTWNLCYIFTETAGVLHWRKGEGTVWYKQTETMGIIYLERKIEKGPFYLWDSLPRILSNPN